MNPDEREKKVEKILAQALLDKGFKQKLISNPASVFKAEGLDTPSGVELRVVEDTEHVRHLVLPVKPSVNELSDEQLQQIAGGLSATTGAIRLATSHARLACW